MPKAKDIESPKVKDEKMTSRERNKERQKNPYKVNERWEGKYFKKKRKLQNKCEKNGVKKGNVVTNNDSEELKNRGVTKRIRHQRRINRQKSEFSVTLKEKLIHSHSK